MRGGGHAAEEGAELEDEEEGEEGELGAEFLVDLAGEGLEGAAREEVGASVPADVLEGVEVGCDSGDCLWGLISREDGNLFRRSFTHCYNH